MTPVLHRATVDSGLDFIRPHALDPTQWELIVARFAHAIAEDCANEAEKMDDLESEQGLGAKYAAETIRTKYPAL